MTAGLCSSRKGSFQLWKRIQPSQSYSVKAAEIEFQPIPMVHASASSMC
jgi:hypothetical protein